MDEDLGQAPADWRAFTDDAEIGALLDFDPAPHKCPRRDGSGWSADNQRIYVVALAETGSAEIAAHRVGLSSNGAYQRRKIVGGEAFGAAWDAAMALYRRRHRAGGRPAPAAAPRGGKWVRNRKNLIPEDEGGPSSKEFGQAMLRKYLIKLSQERQARLAGRVVAADFYVRQLCWFEVLLDLGEVGMEALDRLKRGDVKVTDIVATPLSLLLEWTRLAYWREHGEPERPTPAALGLPERDDLSTGEPNSYSEARDGDMAEWQRRRDATAAVRAEAQKLWEEKARADAAAWAEREGVDRPVPRRRPGPSGADADPDGPEFEL
jgi:hypothetical protein